MHKKNKNYWTFMFKYTNIELTVKRNKKQEGNKRMKGNVIVGQSGGPTAAINASLAGVYRTAKDRGANKVYGMLHGIQGLLKEKYIDLSDHIKTELDAELLKRTPAAFLGSCRYKLPEIHENREVYDKIFEILDKLDIEVFIYIGGNDSMDTIKKLSDYAIIFGHAIRFIGCPKTIDNDLALTDHTPGYGSAARFIAASTQEVGEDVKSLPIHVCIMEAMGRNAGWITAASALARRKQGDAPHLIYLPERNFNEDEFLEDVSKLQKKQGGVVVLVSEGLHDANGESIVPPIFKSERAVYYGDVSSHLANLVVKKLGVKARSEKPGLCGRASVALQSPVDREEARQAGTVALRSAVEGNSGVMVGFERVPGTVYQMKTKLVPIKEVMLYERKMPDNFINERGNDVTQEFVDWCRPLIGDPLPEFLNFKDYL